MHKLLPLALFAACTPPEADPAAVDKIREFPEAPEGALVWETPVWEIPAYSERQMCVVHTYDGPDIGLHAQYNYQSPFGHHLTVFGTNATERTLAEGHEWDCTSSETLSMADMDPILIGGDIAQDPNGVLNTFILPDGMAASLQSGQRIVLQSHYVNTTADDILVQDATQIEVIPAEEVETWAAPLVNTITEFSIPANTPDYELKFDCTFEQPYTMLYLGGHLHEWGTRFSVDYTKGETQERIYEVAEWLPEFRDAPLYESYDNGAFEVAAGDTFTTTCAWNNNEDHALQFPQEMCVTFGMVYPSKVPVICDAEDQP
jgi:hypothetical protein